MRIEILSPACRHFDTVVELHRRDKARLGPMPRGAFEEYAAKQKILVAIDARDECVAYLLYRFSSGRAMIVHLCANANYRRSGVGKLLVERLKSETSHLEGIGLSCRRDYGVDGFWQRCGFHPVGERLGRGFDPKPLTVWWLGHGHPTLFSQSAEQWIDERISVVLDANVFFDLFETETNERREESKAVLADWLANSLELCLTPEIHAEINRSKDDKRRKSSRENVFHFRMLEVNAGDVVRISTDLAARYKFETDDQDQSDLRQIANAIAGKAEYFVTHDTRLREIVDGLYESHGLTLVTPADLVNRLDILRREQDYQPAKLNGANIDVMLLRAEHEDAAIEAFQCTAMGEKRSDFFTRLRFFLSHPDIYSSRITAEEGKLQSLLVTKKAGDELEVSLFRVARGSLGPTLARHILEDTLQQAAAERRSVVRFTDKYIAASIASALQECRFWPADGGAVKVALKGLFEAQKLGDEITSIIDRMGSDLREQKTAFADLVSSYAFSPTAVLASEIEHAFWPAKIKDAPLPSFIVPIWPIWAAEFFHTKSAEGLMFGARKDIRFNAEGVYYRANQACGLSAPGRILWYVSKGRDGSYPLTQAVVACSRLEEVVVGKPKELYRAFRRLGVYDWRHVLEAADGNLHQDLMALRFSHTEAFAHEVNLSALSKLDIAHPIVSPRPVSPIQFAAIHMAGAGHPV